MNLAIAQQRLQNQRLVLSGCHEVTDVVSWFDAVQAQEYALACWGIGQRVRAGATASAIECAFNEGRILRTHVMRPTWHFVAPDDIRWMLTLTADRVRQALAYAFRYYELSKAMTVKAASVFEDSVSNGRNVTRGELGTALAHAGIAVKGVPLALLTIYGELEGILCSGPRQGKQMMYASLPHRAPNRRQLSRDEALGELAVRFFRSHGPATLKDFMWWSGLTATDAKKGVQISRAHSKVIDGLTYWSTVEQQVPTRQRATSVQLLPSYDEYLVAYRDLAAVPRRPAGPGGLQQTVIVDGEVVGPWKAAIQDGECVISVKPYRRLTNSERGALGAAVLRYGRFLGIRTLLKS